MKGLCIFDFDGTLANTLNSIAFFGNSALETQGLKPLDTELYRKMVGNGAAVLLHRMVKASYGRESEELYERVKRVYDCEYGKRPSYLVAPYEGMKELLCRLRSDGWFLGINSNKPDELTKQISFEIFGAKAFDHIMGQREDVAKKPAPDAALKMMRQCGVEAGRCFYIGDSDVDIATGKNAGIHTIGAAWGFRGREELEQAGAEYIAENAEGVFGILKNI